MLCYVQIGRMGHNCVFQTHFVVYHIELDVISLHKNFAKPKEVNIFHCENEAQYKLHVSHEIFFLFLLL